MKLTPEIKSKIDGMTYEQLLAKWRFTPIGDPMFQDESGQYFSNRMKELRSAPGGNEAYVAASKKIGW